VHPRHVEEIPLHLRQGHVGTECHGLLGQGEGQRIAGERGRRAAMDVPRELVEDDDLGQASRRVVAPGKQLAAGGLRKDIGEVLGDLSIKRIIGLPPLRRSELVEPELQDGVFHHLYWCVECVDWA